MTGSADALRPALPDGARWAPDLVECAAEIRPAVHRALRDVVLVDDLAAAAELVAGNPELRAVTPDGDVRRGVRGGRRVGQGPQLHRGAGGRRGGPRQPGRPPSAPSPSCANSSSRRAPRWPPPRRPCRRRRRGQAGGGEPPQRRRPPAGRAGRGRPVGEGGDRPARRLPRPRRGRPGERDLAALAELEERLRLAEATPIDAEPSTEERDQLARMVPQARQNEMEVRLAVRTAEERVASIAGRADSLLRQATAERAARERAAARRAARARGAAHRPRRRRSARGSALTRLTTSIADGRGAPRRGRPGARRPGGGAAGGTRGRQAARRGAGAADQPGAPRRGGPGRAAAAHRAAGGEGRRGLRARRGDADRRVRPAPARPADPGRGRRGRARRPAGARAGAVTTGATQEKRAAKAERELALLGKVNPLALEEFAALEERFKFLSDQLEDLKATRRDLLTVVKDVDERILEVFASAFEDTAREFEQVFTVLFPGGEGRLVLTDPDDLLTTGVEVEARPPGKKIKRLSLLSGGERSLTAVAMLVAIFRARPSPFYIMDEVEAALDDVNLGRLITLLAQLREKSQLIIITHQKRTMEIADALYGVTMRSGVTQVISQRLNRDREEDRGRPRRTGSGRRATALLLVDFDGVLRRWDPAVAAGDRAAARPAPTACSPRSRCEWARLQPAITGQISHAEWMAERGSSAGRAGRRRPETGPRRGGRSGSAYRGEVDPEVLAFVREVRAAGLRVGLATNATDLLDADLAALGLVGEFDVVVNSSAIGVHKPAPEFFQAGCVAVAPRRPGCLFVDDEDRAVRGARVAGLSAHRWSGPADLRYLRAALAL